MPELPEVEAMARRLERHGAGRVLERVETVDHRVLSARPGAPEGVGAPIRAVRRRAKYLLFDVGDATWILHFRMTGLLVLGPGARHVRARLWLGPGAAGAPDALSLEDSRCLAEIWRAPAEGVPAFFDAIRLGPEPWPERREPAWWAERLGARAAPLKPALMDQARIGGLGNITASEICFRAQLSPHLPTRALTPAALSRLADAAWTFLEAAVADADADDLRYINAGGANPFLIYQRDGEPCPRCGETIRRTVQSGRGTWLCPRCQPPPAGISPT